MPKVRVIPATIEKHSMMPINEKTRRKVAGYARVSTNHEEQQTSYAAQVDYYTSHIRSNPEWEFAGVYTDEGISALSTKSRDGFNQMIQDAFDGKIDLILTKSVSRFARNTVDSLSTIRALKDKGIEVYFEKENIWTFDSKGELLLTIMSSLAQEESRSISENITWGHRKRFADGKIWMPFTSFLGYRRGEDGQPEIVPEEAELVRRIYRMFMQGKSPNAIAKILTAEHIPTPRKKEVWRLSTIESILQNEKYKGDAVLQKKFTVDFLNKKLKKNEGEVPQYYVTDSHPSIIDKTEWENVQTEFAKRKASGRKHLCAGPFSGKLICGDCGAYFGSKVWHSTDKYRRVIWQCNDKFKNEKKCETPHLYEEDIKRLFMAAMNELVRDRTDLIEDCEYMLKVFSDTSGIDDTLTKLMEEMNTISILTENLISGNASKPMDQDEYNSQYDKYTGRYNKAKAKHDELQKLILERKAKAKDVKQFIDIIGSADGLPGEFNENFWNGIIDHVTVNADETLDFTFINGQTIKEAL